MQDEKKRSLLKGMTWRCIATTDTVFLSWLFTGSITAALAIGGLELITKSVLYYTHERVWVRAPKFFHKKRAMRTLRSTSVYKAITWRLFGAIDTMILATLITGDVGVAASIGGVEVVTKLTLYYFHERLWSTVRWGRVKIF